MCVPCKIIIDAGAAAGAEWDSARTDSDSLRRSNSRSAHIYAAMAKSAAEQAWKLPDSVIAGLRKIDVAVILLGDDFDGYQTAVERCTEILSEPFA